MQLTRGLDKNSDVQNIYLGKGVTSKWMAVEGGQKMGSFCGRHKWVTPQNNFIFLNTPHNFKNSTEKFWKEDLNFCGNETKYV